MAIMVQPIFFNGGMIFTISEELPLFEIKRTMSFLLTMPKSPCIASEAFTNIDCVPVEASDEEILWPIMPVFPTPIITNLPLQL